MKSTVKIALVGLLLAACAFGQSSQFLTQTTLSAAVAGPTASQAASYDTQVTLASATGITTAFNGQPVTYIYVDGELMGILDNPTGTTFNVLRGQEGTKISGHVTATMVLAQKVSPQFGGFQGVGGFQKTDPPYGSTCTAAATLTPWVNIQSAAQWICSTVTGTYVPGFNNPLSVGSGARPTTLVASAAGAILPSGPLFHVNGTAAITGFTVPVGFNATAAGGGCFVVIPDAVFTYTAAGNIAPASTGLNAGTAVVVVNQPITFCWDAVNSKFNPNTQ